MAGDLVLGSHHPAMLNLQDIQAYARKAAESGLSLDYWLAQGIPAPYDTWGSSHVYEWNFRWLFDQYSAELKEGSGV